MVFKKPVLIIPKPSPLDEVHKVQLAPYGTDGWLFASDVPANAA